ncbi:unnamed protein product [Calypogeia fissa]
MENCPSLKCFYSILGVEKGSSAAEIRTAYRKLAMRWHPDKCSNAKGDSREQAKLKFQVVQEAYSVLSDETKRLMYDHGLHDDDDDPGLRDFMTELLHKMKEASPACSKRSADQEFQELNQLFKNVADTENYVRDCQQFDSSARTSCSEQPETNHQPSTADSPPKPHPNLFKANGCSEYSFWGDCVNAAREFTCEFEKPTTSCPQPHPNLHRGPDLFDHSADHLLDVDFLNFISTPNSVLKEPQISQVSPAQCSVNPEQTRPRSTQNNFTSAFQTSTIENSTTPVGSAASANFFSDSFCMGVGGGGLGRECRGQGKSVKSRRKRR